MNDKKRIPSERRWFNCSIQEIKQKEFEIIYNLSSDYSIKSLCQIMNVSRSGYYKWLKNKDILNNYEVNRKDLGELITGIHSRKPSYGYRRINAIIRRETGWIVSNNLVHKVCKLLKIRSKAKHYSVYRKPGEESIKYPNLIKGNWETNLPLEKVVTDTTMICLKNKRYDQTYYVDVFNDEIIESDVRIFQHCSNPFNHKKALKSMLESKIKKI